MTNTNAIEFQQVNFETDGLHILKNITGGFPKGKITTLVGPSGAGKSTLFQLCNGLKSPSSGDIFVDEQNIEEYPPTDLRRKVGIALQQATMIDGTVLTNLQLPLTLKGESIDMEIARELSTVVGLDSSFLERKVGDLSGGQRQKLSIARTLVNRPPILLLDEITSSLDRVSQQDIEHLVERINHNYGTTIIWITHNLTQAIEIGHYTWVMIAGELVESGPTSILTNPQNERVRQFVKGDA